MMADMSNMYRVGNFSWIYIILQELLTIFHYKLDLIVIL